MPDRSQALTPDALLMIDAIARTGSFAAAARELGKVPSALTYSVRQLEEALDVLLFDRRSRQARFTAAGEELLREGRRLLASVDEVANRVRRVASGWESEITIAFDDIISRRTVFELCEAFFALDLQGLAGSPSRGGPGTRIRLRAEVMSGTWEALVSGQADLAIGVGAGTGTEPLPAGVAAEPLGELPFVFAVSPHHPLAGVEGEIGDAELMHYRSIAVADSALRLSPRTINVLPGQDVLTVNSMAEKIELQRRGVGCGFVPQAWVQGLVDRGELVVKSTTRPPQRPRLAYAWRCTQGPKGVRRPPPGLALQWWLQQLASPATRRALLDGPG